MEDKDYVEINKEAYDLMSEAYAKKRNRKGLEIKNDLVHFSEYIERFQKPKILEIGPGAGIALTEFEKRGFITSAIDISQKMVEVAKQVAPNTNYHLGNFIDYDFGEEKFHGVFARSVIHLFPLKELPDFFKKTYEILETNGLAFVYTFDNCVGQEGILPKKMEGQKFERFKRELTTSELENLARKSPFRDFSLVRESSGDSNAIKIKMELIK